MTNHFSIKWIQAGKSAQGQYLLYRGVGSVIKETHSIMMSYKMLHKIPAFCIHLNGQNHLYLRLINTTVQQTENVSSNATQAGALKST